MKSTYDRNAGKTNRSAMQQLGPYLGLGFQLVAAVVAFGALGWWLDKRLGTDPWLLVTGLMLGAVGGMISFIRTALRSNKNE
jgi:ATP synthase protein I